MGVCMARKGDAVPEMKLILLPGFDTLMQKRVGKRIMGRHKTLVLIVLAGVIGAGEVLPEQDRVSSAFRIARVKYSGGGDWYNDPSAEVNLLNFIHEQIDLDVDARYTFVEPASEDLFTYPFLFLTGHGNITLNETETRRLRTYLENGGFLFADDDYGMDKAFRREMKKVFPEKEFVELPFDHGIYSVHFDFSQGPPKTHAHDEHPPRGFGLFHNDRLIVFYTYESNPSDGWADPDVHKDPEEKRLEALRFGTNVVLWVLTH